MLQFPLQRNYDLPSEGPAFHTATGWEIVDRKPQDSNAPSNNSSMFTPIGVSGEDVFCSSSGLVAIKTVSGGSSFVRHMITRNGICVSRSLHHPTHTPLLNQSEQHGIPLQFLDFEIDADGEKLTSTGLLDQQATTSLNMRTGVVSCEWETSTASCVYERFASIAEVGGWALAVRVKPTDSQSSEGNGVGICRKRIEISMNFSQQSSNWSATKTGNLSFRQVLARESSGSVGKKPTSVYTSVVADAFISRSDGSRAKLDVKIEEENKKLEELEREETLDAVLCIKVCGLCDPHEEVRMNLTVFNNEGGEVSLQPSAMTYPFMHEAHRVMIRGLWEHAHINIELQDEVYLQQLPMAMRFCMYTLLCNAAGCGPLHGVTKTGLTKVSGDGVQMNFTSYLYHGLFLTFTAPNLAQRLLEAVYSMLPAARALARRLSLPSGASYPAQTITQPECGAYFLNTTARFHVSADIAYVIRTYFEAVDVATHIRDNFAVKMLEVVLETARMWLHVGHWSCGATEFRVDNVTGPDEYNAFVEDDFYTKLLAKQHLALCISLADRIRRHAPAAVAALLDRLQLTKEETLDEMQRASEGIIIHRDDRCAVYFTHKHFDTCPEWDAAQYTLQHPLSHHFHPLVIYRHKVCQLPAVLLGMLLMPEMFERIELRRNLKYYELLCTCDVPEALAIIAAIRYKAYGDFGRGMEAIDTLARFDLESVAMSSAQEGLHLSTMAATWFVMAFGILGLEVQNGMLYLSPSLPFGWSSIEMSINFRGSTVLISISPLNVRYKLVSGEAIHFLHNRETGVHLYAESSSEQFGSPTSAGLPKIASFKELPRMTRQPVTAHFDGVLFSLETIACGLLHMEFEAWHDVLQELFSRHSNQSDGDPIKPFTFDEFVESFVLNVDEGDPCSALQSTLLQRSIELDRGDETDAQIVQTLFGLRNAKEAEFSDRIAARKEKIPLVPNILELLRDLRIHGLRVAVVSYSPHMLEVLPNLDVFPTLITTWIEGKEARQKKYRGRPHVDIYAKAAAKMHILPSRCVVFASLLTPDYQKEFGQFLKLINVSLQGTREAAAYSRSVIALPEHRIPTTVSTLEDLIFKGR